MRQIKVQTLYFTEQQGRWGCWCTASFAQEITQASRPGVDTRFLQLLRQQDQKASGVQTDV